MLYNTYKQICLFSCNEGVLIGKRWGSRMRGHLGSRPRVRLRLGNLFLLPYVLRWARTFPKMAQFTRCAPLARTLSATALASSRVRVDQGDRGARRMPPTPDSQLAARLGATDASFHDIYVIGELPPVRSTRSPNFGHVALARTLGTKASRTRTRSRPSRLT